MTNYNEVVNWNKDLLLKNLEVYDSMDRTFNRLYDEAEETKDLNRKLYLFGLIAADAMQCMRELQQIILELTEQDKIK